MRDRPRIGVVGATGAVGRVTLELLAGRDLGEVRAFASSRSAGRTVPFGSERIEVEEARPEFLGAGDLDLAFFSVGTATSRELVPPAADGGAVCIDKSDAYRLVDGVPLVVAGVNDQALDGDRIVANPNCSAIQLSCVLAPLHEAAGLARVRLATYQSVSGAGDAAMQRLRATPPAEADLAMDWGLDGEELTEEWKLREETRKILALPGLPLQAQCVRAPVLVGHAQAVWVETEDPLSPAGARDALADAPNLAFEDLATPGAAAGRDEVLVGRIRRDPTVQNGLALWIVNDNLRKGAALNAVQVAERLLARRRLAA
ncbi:MAG TPA: Asd/ArgC dimerization domain-containing protein [Gaiellaceae bacterium]|jgi:aspartate-semialdehyde dehydrogenase|nr:Asd/ArgC dimerization domain-containing protein [Gaiellaceae bacterium]